MSEDVVHLSLALPLDSDRFLRRQCSTCEREFKLRPTSGDETVIPVPDGGYYCPYCGIQASPDSWFTQAQIGLVRSTAISEVLAPGVDDFRRSLESGNRKRNVVVKTTVNFDESQLSEPLTELDDMKRVDFLCHPSEPLKVLDDWSAPVHCLFCGTTSS